MRKVLMACLLLAACIAATIPAVAGGRVLIYDRSASSIKEHRAAARSLGVSLHEIAAISGIFVQLAPNPTQAEIRTALSTLPTGGIIVFDFSTLTNHCTDPEKAARMVAIGCVWRNAPYKKSEILYTPTWNPEAARGYCVDGTRIELRNCTGSP